MANSTRFCLGRPLRVLTGTRAGVAHSAMYLLDRRLNPARPQPQRACNVRNQEPAMKTRREPVPWTRGTRRGHESGPRRLRRRPECTHRDRLACAHRLRPRRPRKGRVAAERSAGSVPPGTPGCAPHYSAQIGAGHRRADVQSGGREHVGVGVLRRLPGARYVLLSLVSRPAALSVPCTATVCTTSCKTRCVLRRSVGRRSVRATYRWPSKYPPTTAIYRGATRPLHYRSFRSCMA